MALKSWYEKGMTFEQYRTSMQVNQQELNRIYEQLVLSEEDVKTFEDMAKRNWSGIVLTADWCGDAALCVPIVQRIAELSNMELRFLIRDENLELMDQYLTNGTSRSIPIFIFIDQDGQETKVWGPRSPEVQEFITSLRAGLPAADAPDFQEKQQNVFRQFKERITTDPAVWGTVVESVKAKLQD
ncbi:thioredoxin family protein [Aneurinibacillus tyrosinisolvens]|uniref:thioredoxin family protein n=1 Tax=Aneurinibacillus tyrosinisolvens TaxID=1443435 RepID=UPI00063FB33A|nr:thioredoxin family protein [Aneurinibacillus tyrosinisolvens]